MDRSWTIWTLIVPDHGLDVEEAMSLLGSIQQRRGMSRFTYAYAEISATDCGRVRHWAVGQSAVFLHHREKARLPTPAPR
jgi:hypothetical protein